MTNKIDKLIEALQKQCNELELQNRKLKQECEELKDYARRQENQRETYYKELLKKTKALEEIEGIVKNWYKNEWSCYMCRKNMDKKLEDILNIVNKVKEN